MKAGAFNHTNTIVTIPELKGTGLSGNLKLKVRQQLKLTVLTFDDYRNPIEEEREWPIFNISSATHPVYSNMTWTVEPKYLKNGIYTAMLIFTKAANYTDLALSWTSNFSSPAPGTNKAVTVSVLLADLKKIDAPDWITVIPGPCANYYPEVYTTGLSQVLVGKRE